MNSQIRRAKPPDASAIAEVHVGAWRETYAGIVPDAYLASLSVEKRFAMWNEGLTRTEEAGKPSNIHVALATDGKIVGFANGGKSRSPEYPYEAELFAIYLLRAYQGSGLGRRLFEAVVKDQLDAGLRSMMLWVLAANSTLGFYERMRGVRFAAKNEEIGGAVLAELGIGCQVLG